MIRRFHLQRDVDVSGVSGTGIVAIGAVFPTGRVVLEWTAGEVHSFTIYQSVGEVEQINGHNGATQIVWEEDLPITINFHAVISPETAELNEFARALRDAMQRVRKASA